MKYFNYLQTMPWSRKSLYSRMWFTSRFRFMWGWGNPEDWDSPMVFLFIFIKDNSCSHRYADHRKQNANGLLSKAFGNSPTQRRVFQCQMCCCSDPQQEKMLWNLFPFPSAIRVVWCWAHIRLVFLLRLTFNNACFQFIKGPWFSDKKFVTCVQIKSKHY